MNETFKGKGFGLKEWTVTDEYLIFKGENISFEKLGFFNLVTTPTTPLTNGVVQSSYNGKILTLSFAYDQKARVHEVIEFVKRKLDEANGIEKDYKYLLTSKTGSKLEVYDDYVILYFMPVGSLIANIDRKDGVMGAVNDENTIIVDNNNLVKAKEVVKYIETKRKNLKSSNSSSSQGVSSADEIAKFKKLLDDGTITQEEFDAKKKQLLGL